MNNENFSQMSLSNLNSLITWQNLQMAQWCVNNKLKTTIGKAQDTLTSFAEVLRKKASQATQNKSVDPVESRRILSFFDMLEKSFVNASDGSSQKW